MTASKMAVVIGCLLLSGCTYVSADATTGQVRVITFMTARQDVVVGRKPDGTSWWSAKESTADASIGNALENVSAAAAKLAGAPVAVP